MYRSWAYILMVVATLGGIVALVWPSPTVRTIEEIAMPAKPAPRAETPKAQKSPQKPAQAAKAPKPAPAPAAPAVVKKMPQLNTTTRRTGPNIQNGMGPGLLGKPVEDGTGRNAMDPPKPPVTAKPIVPQRTAPAAPPEGQ